MGQLARLELFGPQLPFPYSSQVEGELRELRCHIGKRHIRFLYRRSDKLAERVGTTGSAISRLESGQHAPHLQTLKRIAEVAGDRFVVGFEQEEADTRDLVAV